MPMQHCSSQLGKLNRSSKKSSKLMLLPTVNPDAANLKGLAVALLRSRIRVLRAIGEILLGEPGALGIRLGDVDALDLEHHGTRTVVAAGDHHALVRGPAAHDGAALQGRVDVAADAVPRLRATLAPSKASRRSDRMRRPASARPRS